MMVIKYNLNERTEEVAVKPKHCLSNEKLLTTSVQSLMMILKMHFSAPSFLGKMKSLSEPENMK